MAKNAYVRQVKMRPTQNFLNFLRMQKIQCHFGIVNSIIKLIDTLRLVCLDPREPIANFLLMAKCDNKVTLVSKLSGKTVK